MRKPKRLSRTGSVVGEAIVALPVLFTALAVVADLGRVFVVRSAVANASHRAARVGALAPPNGASAASWVAKIEATASDYLNGYPWYSAANLALDTPTTVDCNGLTCVRVSMSYDFHSYLDIDGLIPTITVAGSATLPMVQ